MKRIEVLKIGLNELKSNKMRTSLTMLGIVFGVAAVIAMLSIGEGAKQETIEQIELMGTNNIIINKVIIKEKTKESKTSFSPGLSTKDADAIIQVNPYVQVVVPQREIKNNVTYKSNIIECKIIGTTPDFFSILNSKMDYGTFFKKYDLDGYSNVCVIGSGVKDKFFKFEEPIQKKIKIGTLWFNVIGVVASKNTAGTEGLGIRNFNEDIYVPFSTMAYKMEKLEEQPDFGGGVFFFYSNSDQALAVVDKTSVDQLVIKIDNSDNLKEAAHLITKTLERKHFGVKDYEVILPEQLLEQKQKTQKIFNIVMGAIAGISLLVGGIGIMNIMLANILERTREIGVRRAIGATKRDLIDQFIFEALTISITGGILGIVLGFILTSAITSYAEWRTIITPFSVILAFFVSAAVGLGFGIYPAKKAADKDPIEALRYE
ncbi:MAG: ABC transporter permease [Ignavibacteriales bacterium]|nr:ABC transporter permease [Ignavibacteriales bacterium]